MWDNSGNVCTTHTYMVLLLVQFSIFTHYVVMACGIKINQKSWLDFWLFLDVNECVQGVSQVPSSRITFQCLSFSSPAWWYKSIKILIVSNYIICYYNNYPIKCIDWARNAFVWMIGYKERKRMKASHSTSTNHWYVWKIKKV